ncbi:hypothetical protein [Actinophytocola sp.]|uniref:hypothetical protein n=1 Tax=Actinophytocola sp. TaxID=1872138 RepID=UPI003D6BCAC9
MTTATTSNTTPKRPAAVTGYKYPRLSSIGSGPPPSPHTVAILTQQDDRPTRRSPWHVLESFELTDWIHALDPYLDAYHVEAVLRDAIPFIRDTLDPADHDSEPAGTADSSPGDPV